MRLVEEHAECSSRASQDLGAYLAARSSVKESFAGWCAACVFPAGCCKPCSSCKLWERQSLGEASIPAEPLSGDRRSSCRCSTDVPGELPSALLPKTSLTLGVST